MSLHRRIAALWGCSPMAVRRRWRITRSAERRLWGAPTARSSRLWWRAMLRLELDD